jgi:potassium channel subfamily K
LFGAITRNTPSYSFLEGFWCAYVHPSPSLAGHKVDAYDSTVSLITSGLVTALLVYHFFTDYLRQRKGPEHMQHVHRQVRISGRHFMLSTTLFIAWIALMALVFSRIEG